MRRVPSARAEQGAGRRISVVVLPVLVLLTTACTMPKEPTAPSWEVEYNIPLLNQWIDLVDLFDDEDFETVGLDSVYTIDFEESLDRIEMGEDITIDGLDESVAQSIGSFTVPAAPAVSATVQFDQIYPILVGLPPQQVIIPPFSIPAGLTQDIPSLSSFTHVTIDSGTMSVRVTNRTEVPFEIMGVKLLDDAAGDTLVVDIDVTAGGTDVLTDGEIHIIPVILDGLSLSNDLSIELYGSSSGETMYFDGDEGIDVEVEFSALTVAMATAQVDPISFPFSETVTLPGDASITSATLGGGDLTLSLDNQLPIDLNLVVSLPNLVDYWGDPLNFNLAIPAGQTQSESRDLTDVTLTPDGVGAGNQTLALNVTVDSPGSYGSQVTLSAQDSVSVRALLSELVLQSVTGTLDATTVDVPADSFSLAEDSGNLLDELRKISLADVDLDITVVHTIGFPAHLELHLVGTGGTPDPVNLDITFDLQPGSEAAPDTSTLSFGDDSALLTFLNAFPEEISYSGSVTVGDGVTPGTLSSTSWVEAEIAFSTPLSFNIDQPISIELDKEFQAEGIDVEEDVVTFQEASITYRFASTLGLGITARYTTAADSGLVFTDPDVDLVLTFQPNAATAQDTVVTLTRDQWQALLEPYWSGMRITIPPTGTEPFKVAKSDRIFVKAFVTVRAIIDPDAGDDGEGR